LTKIINLSVALVVALLASAPALRAQTQEAPGNSVSGDIDDAGLKAVTAKFNA
jgi:hypothetical protein